MPKSDPHNYCNNVHICSAYRDMHDLDLSIKFYKYSRETNVA